MVRTTPSYSRDRGSHLVWVIGCHDPFGGYAQYLQANAGITAVSNDVMNASFCIRSLYYSPVPSFDVIQAGIERLFEEIYNKMDDLEDKLQVKLVFLLSCKLISSNSVYIKTRVHEFFKKKLKATSKFKTPVE